MITEFRNQDSETVIPFLRQLGTAPNCYSKRTAGLAPLIEGADVYLYADCDSNEIVVVMIDTAPSDAFELADEERFMGERPLWFSDKRDHRVSPVWQLAVTCELLRKRLRLLGKQIPQVWGAFLSSSCILNVEDVRPVWDLFNVSVLRVADLGQLALPVNDDSSLSMCFPLAFFYQSEFQADEIEAVEDGLEKLTEGQNAPDQTLEEDTDDNEESSLGDAMKDFDFDAFESWARGDGEPDNDTPDIDLDLDDDDDSVMSSNPFGVTGASSSDVIQQNNNTQVRVKVLQPLEHPREELARLVGCSEIKRRIDELTDLSRYNRLMRRYNPGGKQHQLSQHCVFSGNPGTGKSTVARIFGSLLKEAGVLSRGHVVVANRGTFVGTNWGDEERAVNQVVEKAMGGVLMIDEAYLLSTPHPNDPGKLVLQLLMDLLADEKERDLAVVICGYKDEMEGLLRLNPGLDSRFSNRFDFPDFTVDELMDICQRRVKEYNYHFTRAAWVKLRKLIDDAYAKRDEKTWGNARFVANLLDKVYTRHACRCIKLKAPDSAQIFSLTPADIVPLDTTTKKAPAKAPANVCIAGFKKR